MKNKQEEKTHFVICNLKTVKGTGMSYLLVYEKSRMDASAYK